MIKAFFANFFTSLLIAIVSAFIVLFGGFVVYLVINKELLYNGLKMVVSAKWSIIECVLIGLVFSFIVSAVVTVVVLNKQLELPNQSSPLLVEDEVSYRKAVLIHLPILLIGVISLLILVFFSISIFNTIDGMESGLLSEELLAKIFIPLSIGVSMIFYYLMLCTEYDTYACAHCRYINTIYFQLEETKTSEDTEYRTKTSKEKVGSLYIDDTEIAEAYGTFSKTESRDVQITHRYYKGKCSNCGHINKVCVTDKESGSWS